MIRGRRADGGLALILDAVDVAESVCISIPTTGGQNCRYPGLGDADLEMPRATGLAAFFSSLWRILEPHGCAELPIAPNRDATAS
jgi:hypothetical protein